MMSSLLKTQKKEIYQNEFIERIVEFKGGDKNKDGNDTNLRISMSEAKPNMRLYQSMQVESNYFEGMAQKDKPQFQILDETADRIEQSNAQHLTNLQIL